MKPSLVIMAAGMGSRYGGCKQIDKIDEDGHIIIDFSIYDALKAGFEKIVVIIKKGIEADFREAIGNRIEKQAKVEYVFQELDNLPEGFTVPDGRTKPWGTEHAIWCCRNVVDGPFAVINADDYYGAEAFKMMYDALTNNTDDSTYHMVGYVLANTLTENGTVSRGVCSVDENGFLEKVVERTKICKTENGAAFSEDGGETWQDIDQASIVSMNLWGFNTSMMDDLNEDVIRFMKTDAVSNPLKSESFLPSFVQKLLSEGKAKVKVLATNDKWFGVTYKEDKEKVVSAIRKLKEAGVYPEHF